MRYPVAIELGDEANAVSVVVPDLPGCFSAGDTLDEALTNAEAVMTGWIDATLDASEAIPAPSRRPGVRGLDDRRGVARWRSVIVQRAT